MILTQIYFCRLPLKYVVEQYYQFKSFLFHFRAYVNLYKKFVAALLMALNDSGKAELTYWKLVDRNPENIMYYKQIEKCRGLGVKFFWY